MIEAFKTLGGTSDDLVLDLLEEMPSLTRLSIWETKIFPSIMRRIAHDDFLPQLMLLKCTVYNLSYTVNQLKNLLDPSSFMESLDDDLTMLKIVSVPDVERSGIERMKELERNRLKLRLKGEADEDFMNYSDREESDSGGSVSVNDVDSEADARSWEEDKSDPDWEAIFW